MRTILVRNYLTHLTGMAKGAILCVQFWYVIIWYTLQGWPRDNIVSTILVRKYLTHLIGMAMGAILCVKFWYVIIWYTL